MPNLVYLHGFLSSPESSKAKLTGAWCAQQARPDWRFHCPSLSAYPGSAIATITSLLDELRGQPTALIGSSLGGFWATGFAERYGLPAVLINPAVSPQTRFHEFVGQPLRNYYTEDTYTLQPGDLADLASVDTRHLQHPQNLWVLLQTGDETLDYRLAAQKYADCRLTIEEGGNHSFAGYDHWLPPITEFLNEKLRHLP